MVASIKPHRDEIGLGDGLMLIDGAWVPARSGPVLSVIAFSDEDEAVRIANDTQYGLAATVWTSDIKRAIRMTKAIRAGTVGINGYQLEPHAAFGGYRQSGLGREGGRVAIESYTEIKTVLLPFTDEMM